MFLTRARGHYDSGGQQHSGRGVYLALFSWNDYKALDEIRAACSDCIKAHADREAATDHESPAFNHEAFNWARHCNTHSGSIRSGLDIPRYSNGKDKLWATVRHCAMHQCGHFMMGTIRIGGHSITVSGPCGSDGLPMDLQKVPLHWRTKLVEVPEDVATVYWGDDGHNDIGKARPTLHAWAASTFLKGSHGAVADR